MWDTGSTETRVIEHGIVDPGDKWTGELARCAVISNNPVRRGRLVGTDLLTGFAQVAPLDLFGMNASALPETLGARSVGIAPIDELPQALLHHEVARRRLYLHVSRWTSLGFSLIEAMHLGMPIVAVGSTEAWEAVRPDFGFISTRLEDLHRGVRDLVNDHSLALEMGVRARDYARERYGLGRFLADWDRLIKEVVA
jgi:glycosyltransferase involved in cell wall biosynthesis